MNFKSYSEIENTYNEKFLAKVRELHYGDPEHLYMCFSKTDGSNFQCSIDEEDKFVVGSRSNYLERDTNFQGWQRAMKNEDVESRLRKMKEYIFENSDFNFGIAEKKFCLTVYGELCGGFYRHPDVEKVKGAVKIQGRVDYHPDNMWIPFDILLRWTYKNEEETKEVKYLLTQTDVIKYCEMVGLPHEQLLFKGTLDECLKYPVEFTDTIGNYLWHLPIIEGNIAEGVVIKPNVPMWMPNGQRVIFKNKNEKFKERKCKTPKEKKELKLLTITEVKIFNYAREYITESRILSVVSKLGEVNEKQFGVFLGMFLKDLWKDFDKDYADEVKHLEDTTEIEEFSMAKIKKYISKEVSDFIRPTFIKLLNQLPTIED